MTDSSDGKGGPEAAGAPEDDSRRGALRMLVTVGSVAYAGALGVAGASFVTGTVGEASRERWLRSVRLDELTEGQPRRVPMVGDARDAFTVTPAELLGSVWLVRQGSEVRAMSATCPHLGCSIDLTADKKLFSCPCHTSNFELSGATQSGPSPRPMDTLATRVKDGWVEVDFRKFRQGTADKKESGA